MDTKPIVDEAATKLTQVVAHYKDELAKLRVGRAHPSMLDGLTIEAYGTQVPLNQAATITAPEPQLLQISPFDPNNLQAIAAAIRDNQALGLNPMDDGRVVRVPIPPLTTERRQQIVKQLGEKTEDCMIAMRNARHEALKQGDQAKKAKDIGEDEYNRLAKRVDELMAEQKQTVESLAKAKETEILSL